MAGSRHGPWRMIGWRRTSSPIACDSEEVSVCLESTDDRADQLSGCINRDEVCGFARRQGTGAMSEACHGGRVGRQQTQTLLDAGTGEFDEVRESAVECERAAGENAAGGRTAILDLQR